MFALPSENPHELAKRLAVIEQELPALRREVTELAAAHDAALELALHAAVPNVVSAVLDEARDAGWRISYERRLEPGACGTIKLAHALGSVHDCSIDLPLPGSEAGQRAIASEMLMRIRLTRAA